jgi:uncharacterized protein (TIGR03086 family)
MSMADLLERLHTAAAALTRAIAAADTSGAWGADSPCEGWTAGDVADHIINNYIGVAASLGSSVTRTGDRVQDWATARDTVLRAAERNGALDTLVTGPGGEMPLGRFLAIYVEVDTLVHTWDIARAVGADESLDEEVCRRCYERLLPADETMRRTGSFGPKLSWADDDPIHVKALRFFGRPA